MLRSILAASVRHRALVLIVAGVLVALGIRAARDIRLDAIPDLSDVQVIVVTEYPGQNPEVVDAQVTQPLETALLSVPGATVVRGYSMFELSFVYVLFDDDTDIYWARSRVLEYLNFARDRLPRDVEPRLGPDATGVGWVYQYVLFPGWHCAEHAKGVWHDPEAERWYAQRDAAPEEDRERLVRVRGFEHPGACPLDGASLVEAQHDLAELRSLQDWYLRFPLSSVAGVSEVAPIGGYVKQYQVVLDPVKLVGRGLGLEDVVGAIERSNADVGGSVVELAENEYMVRSRGYLRGLEDLSRVVLMTSAEGVPVLLSDVATLEVGGEMRRGVGEYDGRGEAVGGVVVARFGENAYRVIQDVKARLFELEDGLPDGVFVRTTYDRSALIGRAVETLGEAVLEELLVTALVCLAFLGHVRSALVAIVILPIGLLVSILVMNLLGINANIMSLGGLALAIGVMVDSAIVMIENAHKHLERDAERVKRGATPRSRTEIVLESAQEVGPSLFYSLLIITVAFLPIFALGEESGRLFKPLAYTKTFAIVAGAILGITVVPALLVGMLGGRIPKEEENPLNRWSMRLYEPFFRWVMRRPKTTIGIVLLLGASAVWPASKLGSEFMPALDEGDLFYMPTTDPSISVGKSRELLQQTDRIIRSFPEVESVHGKIGRGDTATDPAPLSMLETVVQLHTDPARWRTCTVERFHSGWPEWLAWPFERTFWPSKRTITQTELVYGWQDADGTMHPGLNDAVDLPGVANAWPYPIESRISMLSTGIKTPVGVKILGHDLEQISDLAERTAVALQSVPGTLSAYPERVFGGDYLDFDVKRETAARFGMNVGDVQELVRTAIGGMQVTTTVEGRERYPLNVRFARELRDDLPALRALVVTAPTGARVTLGELCELVLRPGAPMIRTENGERTAWIFVDIAGRDLGGYVEEAKRVAEERVPMPPGARRVWSGRFEYLEAANARLQVVIPITLALIVFLLYLSNRSWTRVAIILLAVPFSLIGAFWFLWWLDYDMSLAVWVGIIALLGIDAETGQVMLLYLDTTFDRWKEEGKLRTDADLVAAIHEGAVQRIRPKTMTVATDMLGLLPLLWAAGSGADVTRRLAAPLVGGITVSFAMELCVYPVLFYLWKRRELRR
ncbi:MAG: efflux RND transporter permease subunit [Planctomycetes bacterium]|nr:efflux RND transporter permease subunit [Planctomycetota bacterium]